MIPGTISLLLLCLGFMNAEPGMLIAAGLFAVASEMGWFIYHVRSALRLTGKRSPRRESSHDKE